MNAAVIGFETDVPHLCSWDMVENMFLLYFTCELFFRIGVLGPKRFFAFSDNADLVWNIFDCLIIGCGICDTASMFVSPTTGKKNSIAMLFRIIRLLRILRIFKIIRFMKQLYLLAYGFVVGV